jgi:hypothetical protein
MTARNTCWMTAFINGEYSSVKYSQTCRKFPLGYVTPMSYVSSTPLARGIVMTRFLSLVMLPLELSYPNPPAQPGETSDKFDCIMQDEEAPRQRRYMLIGPDGSPVPVRKQDTPEAL